MQIAVFIRIAPQPWSRPTASIQRVHFKLRGLIEATRLTTFASHDEVAQIAACAPFVQPQLTPASILHAVDKALPIDVIDVPLWTRAHKSGRNHRATVEASFFVQALSMDQPSGSLSLLTAFRLLHDEPFWKAPDPNSFGGLALADVEARS